MQLQGIISVSYSKTRNRNDLARQFRISPDSVTRFQVLIAAVSYECDKSFLACLTLAFETTPGFEIFGASLCSDATKERRKRPMHDGLPGEAWKSSWNVYVTIQRFGWFMEHNTVPFQTDFVRASICNELRFPINGTYTMPVVEPFTQCEDAAILHAAICFYCDLDRHPSNRIMCAKRLHAANKARKAIASAKPRLPALGSSLHCGNHVEKLCECCAIGVCDFHICRFFWTASHLLGNSGYFLRLIHSLPAVIARFGRRPHSRRSTCTRSSDC